MEKGSFAPLFVHRNNTPLFSLRRTYCFLIRSAPFLPPPPPPPRAPSIRQNYLLHPHAHVLQYFTRANDLRIITYTPPPPPTHPNYRKQNNGRLSFLLGKTFLRLRSSERYIGSILFGVFPIIAPHEIIAPHYGIITMIGGYRLSDH